MKKISQIIAYTLLGVVIVGLVLTAILKKDFAPNINIPSYESRGIEIKEAGVAKYDGLSELDVYNQFTNEYKKSFQLTILYSVVSGKISRTQEIKNLGKSQPTISSGYIVTFNYPENQVLKSNGQVYYENTNSTSETLYKKTFFAVEEGKGLTTKTIYFYCESNSTYYGLTTLANFDGLYNFISNLSIFKPAE